MNSLNHLIDLITGRPTGRPQNNRHNARPHHGTRPQPNLRVPHAVAMTVKKALGQLRFIDRSLRLKVFASKQDFENTFHDLCVMLAHDDLTSVCVEVLDHHKQVVCEWKISFETIRGRAAIVDSAEGIELPLLKPNEVKGHRFLIRQKGKESQYRHLLKRNWSPAETLNRRKGSSFRSEHASKITGGRQKGEVFISNSARHRLRITGNGKKGYAFSKDLSSGGKVWIHQKFAPGVNLRPGVTVTAHIVQTPRGLQARNVKLAA